MSYVAYENSCKGNAIVTLVRGLMSRSARRLFRQELITPGAVRALALARFGFSIQPAILSASFNSTTRIESCDAVIETHEHKGEFKEW